MRATLATCLLLATLFVGPASAPSAVRAATTPFFAGFYPANTFAQQASYQRSVDAGHQPWLLDPVGVSTAFALWVKWGGTHTVAHLVGRRAGHAVVVVSTRATRGPTLTIRLARLGRRDGGVWSVVWCASTNLRIAFPGSGARVTSPLLVQGVERSFEAAYTIDLVGPGGKTLIHTFGMGSGDFGKAAQPFRKAIPLGPIAGSVVVKAYVPSARDGISATDVSMVKVLVR